MALPLLLPVIGLGAVVLLALRGPSGKKTSSTAPVRPTEQPGAAHFRGTVVVNGLRIYDAPTAAKILAQLVSYSTTGIDHQPEKGRDNRAALTYRGTVQEGNDRGFQFAAIENQNGNAIVAPADLWDLPKPPASIVLRAIDPARAQDLASVAGDQAVLVLDAGVLGKHALKPSAQVVADVTAGY